MTISLEPRDLHDPLSEALWVMEDAVLAAVDQLESVLDDQGVGDRCEALIERVALLDECDPKLTDRLVGETEDIGADLEKARTLIKVFRRMLA